MYVCMYVCVCICIRICIFICKFTCKCVRVRVRVRVRVCLSVCLYVCMHIYIIICYIYMYSTYTKNAKNLPPSVTIPKVFLSAAKSKVTAPKSGFNISGVLKHGWEIPQNWQVP